MRRREFIAGVGAAVAWPYVVRAQQALQPVIGFMSARSPEDSANLLRAFQKGLKEEASFVEGDNISIEYRWARGDYALLRISRRASRASCQRLGSSRRRCVSARRQGSGIAGSNRFHD